MPDGRWFPVSLSDQKGWELKRITSRSRGSAEAINRRLTTDERWGMQTGLQFQFNNGASLGVSARSRFMNRSVGGEDHALFVDVAIPIWQAND